MRVRSLRKHRILAHRVLLSAGDGIPLGSSVHFVVRRFQFVSSSGLYRIAWKHHHGQPYARADIWFLVFTNSVYTCSSTQPLCVAALTGSPNLERASVVIKSSLKIVALFIPVLGRRSPGTHNRAVASVKTTSSSPLDSSRRSCAKVLNARCVTA